MYVLELVRHLLKDSLHGGFLKTLALGARVGFLVLVLPALPNGELTDYVYINSVALLVATFGIFGLNDELPRVIGGDRDAASQYSVLFVATHVLALATLGVLWLHSGGLWAIAAYAIAVLSSRVLGGLIRSFDPALNEQLQNLPWVLFLPFVIVTGADSALELIASMVVCQLLVQWYCVVRATRIFDLLPLNVSGSFIGLLSTSIRHGIGKQLSNVCLLGLMRSPVLWPVWLSLELELDGIAFAVAVGEVLSQFGLIPVNRAYSRWCRILPTDAQEWRRAISMGLTWWLMLATAGCAGVLIAAYFGLLPRYQNVELLLLQAALLYSFVPAFRLLRYLLWARELFIATIVIVSLGLFLAAGLTVSLASLNNWLMLILLQCMLAWALLGIVSKHRFPAAADALP